MSNFILPQAVSQNIARAKSLLKRDDPLRALEALIAGLDMYHPATLMGKARFEAEVLIQECITELNRQPQVRALIEGLSRSPKVGILYTPGQEDKVKVLLPILRKGLLEIKSAKENSLVEEREKRKNALQEKGAAYLKAGDLPRGKATLRVLGDEFGEDEGVFVQLGALMLEAQLYFDAAEFLEQALELFPRDSRAYGLATTCYMTLREYEKAETVYLKAIKQFGKHTKTLTNIAKMYLEWNKKEKAFEAADAAYRLDPTNAEAKALLDKLS